jgi:methylthioribulose-1-phosphate dehydratase
VTESELAKHSLTQQLARCGNLFHSWQWSLASSSNYSALLPSKEVIISRSGVDKEYMSAPDFMMVDLAGNPVPPFSDLKPSAETELHTHIYRIDTSAQSVLHTHSRFAVYYSRKLLAAGKIVFTGFEMQKIFDGITTHASTVEIPIFKNSQKMPDIIADFEKYLEGNERPQAYLIEGHGLYAWGKSVLHAKQKIEAMEHLLELKYMEEK